MATPIRQSVPPMRVTYNRAFAEAVQIVQSALQEAGVRWTPDAEQAAVCTLLIAADKHGYLDMWESPEPKQPAQPKITPVKPVSRPVAQSPEDLGPVLAESIRQARERQNQAKPTSDGARATEAVSNPAFSVMLRAFTEIAQELPPEVYTAVLEWHGVRRPEDFRPEQVNSAAACYVSLKNARTEYRTRVADPTSFEHFTAGEGL